MVTDSETGKVLPLNPKKHCYMQTDYHIVALYDNTFAYNTTI